MGRVETIELQRRASELLIQSGRTDAGLAVARDLLRSVGLSLPSSQAEAMRALRWNQVRRKLRGERFKIRSTVEVPHEQLLQLDILCSLATALAPVGML